MKKLLLPLLSILLFYTACKKEIARDKVSEEMPGVAANKQERVSVCHYDPVTGASKTILVTQNALASHLAHGDLLGDCSEVLITICDQDWMVKNLNVDHYRNGDPIPEVTDQSEWAALTTGAWCWDLNNSSNGTTYGRLYNWYAVNDPRGLAPSGWHVASDAEWTTLENCIDLIIPTGNVGGKLKEAGTTHWLSPNTDATNISGFTGLPGGYRDFTGTFEIFGFHGYWWSATGFDAINSWYRYLSYDNGTIVRNGTHVGGGLSVRCIRD